MSGFSFPREQKLKSQKLIDSLFQDGQSIKSFPVIGVWKRIASEESLCQVGFSVSKRNFKRAVDRNTIKRKMREAFRLNQAILKPAEKPDSQLIFMIIFVGKAFPDYVLIEEKIIALLNRLSEID